ncbi:hypothetical protein GE061_010012 [Apolygus lucorum]|uniref:Uncharacterized protein n=1 Tax=Apolygus lucorum TaxID=248454 RepID=A0A8S9Y1W0_APOLU|nr:hypothetical protein GE061_010012 [Apolygus lucorum]
MAKQKTPESSTLKQVVHHVTVARNWEMAAEALFLKKNDPNSLMEALWPRKFISRHLYFAKQVIKQSTGLESLLDKNDVAHYSKSSYKRALMQEFHTLSKLRLDNLRKMDTEDFGIVKCICGNSMDGTAIVCELCHTAMHGGVSKKLTLPELPKVILLFGTATFE